MKTSSSSTESACQCLLIGGRAGWNPGSRRYPEKNMATHFTILAWEIPWTEELGELQSMGLQRVGHNATHTLEACTSLKEELGNNTELPRKTMVRKGKEAFGQVFHKGQHEAQTSSREELHNSASGN